MMKDWKMDYQTADIQDGEVHKIGEQKFPVACDECQILYI
jgi:hypothetical protein